MAHCKKCLTVAGILLASFAGGTVSHWLLSAGSDAHAAEAEQGEKIVRGNVFVLTGKRGKRRGMFMVAKDGAASLAFFDKDGRPRLMLGVSSNGLPALYLMGKNGRARATLSMTTDDDVGLELKDNKGKLRVSVCLFANGVPGILITDKTGRKPAWTATAQGHKTILANAFVLVDEKGKLRAALSVVKGEVGLALYDEKGTTRASLVASKGQPGLNLYDEKGKRVWGSP